MFLNYNFLHVHTRVYVSQILSWLNLRNIYVPHIYNIVSLHRFACVCILYIVTVKQPSHTFCSSAHHRRARSRKNIIKISLILNYFSIIMKYTARMHATTATCTFIFKKEAEKTTTISIYTFFLFYFWHTQF